MSKLRAVFAGTGSYIPETVVDNSYFLDRRFLRKDGRPYPMDNAELIRMFEEATLIWQRRYAGPDQQASDLGLLAAGEAIKNAGIDPEKLDYIIVAHTFGDVAAGSNRTMLLPALASRIKRGLGIQNADCVAYDVSLACAGWVNAVIQAGQYIQSGHARCCLVIGTETFSRMGDPHDRDSMLYADGAGAVVLVSSTDDSGGILAHKTQTFIQEPFDILRMDSSYFREATGPDNVYFKMEGRLVAEMAVYHVPLLIMDMLDNAGLGMDSISKVIIHQANGKLIRAILERLYQLAGLPRRLESVMPETVSWLGNSSVATVPTTLDLLVRGQLPGHTVATGDKAVLVAFGAGIHVSAILYQF